MDVLFAPDWRESAPYQRLLGDALAKQDVRVSFLRGDRRGLPLARQVWGWRRRHPCDWLHLHWPEAYYPRRGDGLDWLRFARFPLDLWLATRGRPLAVTAHNLQAHNRRDLFAFRNTRAAFRRAQVVFAHSPSAAEVVRQQYGVQAARVQIIPHGDMAADLGEPLSRLEARLELGLGAEKVCLMFGAVEPYKGIEEVIAHWREARPVCELHIAGRPHDEAYAGALSRLAEGVERVHLHLEWMPPETLRAWLSAADCALFNFRSIFNSGSAPLARAYGLPILLPKRLSILDLGEPALSVIRFADFRDDFSLRLHQALSQRPDYEGAAPWRAEASWDKVAALTAARYVAAPSADQRG